MEQMTRDYTLGSDGIRTLSNYITILEKIKKMNNSNESIGNEANRLIRKIKETLSLKLYEYN